MAVTFDAVNHGAGTGTSITISHTTTSAAERYMLIGVMIDAGSAFAPTCTYNAVSLGSPIVEVETNRYLAIFGLIAPATGANDAVITLPGGGEQAAVVLTWSGVDQGTPADTPVTSNAATGSSVSNNVSSATGDMVVDVINCNGPGISLVVGADQTQRVNAEAGAGMTYGASTEPGAGTVTMSWSWSGDTANAHIAINVNASTGGGGVSWLPQTDVASGPSYRAQVGGMIPPTTP